MWLIHHTCSDNTIQNTCECFCNCPYFSFRNFLMQTNCPLSPITQKNGLFECQCLVKKNTLLANLVSLQSLIWICKKVWSLNIYKMYTYTSQNIFTRPWKKFTLTLWKCKTIYIHNKNININIKKYRNVNVNYLHAIYTTIDTYLNLSSQCSPIAISTKVFVILSFLLWNFVLLQFF
jgi:hypothetical protein